MQNLKAPEIGENYMSVIDPSLVVCVENVITFDADERGDAGFLAECSRLLPGGKISSIGIEFLNDEWDDHKFSPL